MEAYTSASMFPNIERLLKVLCSVPVTTVTLSPQFGSLKRI